MIPNLHIFETPKETAKAVADLILAKAKEKSKLSMPFNLALSGGSTPKLLFSILSSNYSDLIPWHLVRLFWVDERCVPPTHEESNFGMTFENLLTNVPIPDVNIFRMMGENQPQKEAIRYQEIIENQLPLKNGMPQFDLILLGLGDDGHTASIFPDNLSLLDTQHKVAVSKHPQSSQHRITLTGNVINAANEVIFLVTGTSKSEVLKLIINHLPHFERYPASYIHAQSKLPEFYLDKAAAEKL